MAEDFNWYLYRDNSKDQIHRWARELKIFRFKRAAGGHANDGDQLLAVMRYKDLADLESLFKSLGVNTRRSKSGELEQPGICKIAAEAVYISFRNGTVWFEIAEGYVVSESNFNSAVKIEQVLSSHISRVVDPPIDNDHCVCPKYYPEIFR